MLFTLNKMSPRCPKQHLGDKFHRVSRLPCEYTMEPRLPGVSGTIIWICYQKKLLMPNTAGCYDCTVFSLEESLDSTEYLAPASVLENQFWLNPWGFITGESWLPNRYNGASIMNMNNSTNVWQNLVSFPGMSDGNRSSCSVKNNRDKKSHDTAPFRGLELRRIGSSLTKGLKVQWGLGIIFPGQGI